MQKMKKYLVLAAATFATAISGQALALDNKRCPADVRDAVEATFGAGAADMTRCIQKRRNVKLVYQLNQFTDPSNSSKPYGLGNIQNAINDYRDNYGMAMGKDVDIAVVIHSGAAKMAVQDAVLQSKGAGANPYEATIRHLIDQGVSFYLCQNSARSLIKEQALTPGYATGELIEGVGFVTSGVTAIPDFQSRGYLYVQP
jgi:intracellular sulfur oxidation DsrE/DsrF family protein